MGDQDLDGRVRQIEIFASTHDAVCAERYRGINVKLNVILAGLFIVLSAIAGGHPLVSFLKSLL